jgi:hypothetical protein
MRRVWPLRTCAGALTAGVVLLSATAIARTQERGSSSQRILFIGNSLTTANDLPRLVETLAAAEGGPHLQCTAVTAANFSLEDHWNDGDALRAIRGGGWSAVVLQQGPSSLDESRAVLVDYAERFAAEVRSVGARPALYMVWPSRARRADFERVSASYATAARAVDGVLLPAGDAWVAAWRLDADLALYGSDGFHPSRLGSVLAALVIYRGLVGPATADGYRPSGGDGGVPSWADRLALEPTVAGTLVRAAEEARRRHGG